jgi:hypothetical protein
VAEKLTALRITIHIHTPLRDPPFLQGPPIPLISKTVIKGAGYLDMAPIVVQDLWPKQTPRKSA